MNRNITFIVYVSNQNDLKKFRELGGEDYMPKMHIQLAFVGNANVCSFAAKQNYKGYFYTLDKEQLSLDDNLLPLSLLVTSKIAQSDPFGTEYFFYSDISSLTNLLAQTATSKVLNFLEHNLEECNGIYFSEEFFGASKSLFINHLFLLAFSSTVKNYYNSIYPEYPEVSIKTLQHSTLNTIDKIVNFVEHIPNSNTYKKSFSQLETSLYVLSYNSPQQFNLLLKAFAKSDKNFLLCTKKYLVNNSTDPSVNKKYELICGKYGFEQIRQGNLGISGGRQFIATHFQNTTSDYYLFFEDDMLVNSKMNTTCKMGFRKHISHLFHKSLRIIHQNQFDFLKLSFSEVAGEHSHQWAWNAMSPELKNKYFPHADGVRKEQRTPLANISHIKQDKNSDVSFATGEIYYSNWPMWMSKEGNKKVFVDNIIPHPDELYWMVNVFDAQKKGKISSSVLLASPISHLRTYSYSGTRLEG